MGIRFFCPNGHKLNVKEFLAGRRGICPFCGASVQIPTESTRPSSRPKRDESVQIATHTDQAPQPGPETPRPAPREEQAPAPSPQGVVPSSPPPASQTPAAESSPAVTAHAAPQAPAQQPVSVSPVEPARVAPVESPREPSAVADQPQPAPSIAPDSWTGVGSPSPSSPPPGPDVPPVQSVPDPLGEAPDAVWYVRPESGGQFGPATADVMRSWIDEGRIVAGTLVWREGWRDWQEATATFSQLAADEDLAALTDVATDAASAVSGSPSRFRPPPRRRSNTTNVTLIVVLVLAVIVLLIVFFYVVGGALASSQGTPRHEPIAVVAADADFESPPALPGANSRPG